MRLFQTNKEKKLIRKRFTVRTKSSRPGPSNQIKARPGPGPTKKKCRSGPAWLGPAPSSLMLEQLRFVRNYRSPVSHHSLHRRHCIHNLGTVWRGSGKTSMLLQRNCDITEFLTMWRHSYINATSQCYTDIF